MLNVFETALADSQTLPVADHRHAAAESVTGFVEKLPGARPEVMVVDRTPTRLLMSS